MGLCCPWLNGAVPADATSPKFVAWLFLMHPRTLSMLAATINYRYLETQATDTYNDPYHHSRAGSFLAHLHKGEVDFEEDMLQSFH